MELQKAFEKITVMESEIKKGFLIETEIIHSEKPISTSEYIFKTVKGIFTVMLLFPFLNIVYFFLSLPTAVAERFKKKGDHDFKKFFWETMFYFRNSHIDKNQLEWLTISAENHAKFFQNKYFFEEYVFFYQYVCFLYKCDETQYVLSIYDIKTKEETVVKTFNEISDAEMNFKRNRITTLISQNEEKLKVTISTMN